jgi:hypothetical protein
MRPPTGSVNSATSGRRPIIPEARLSCRVWLRTTISQTPDTQSLAGARANFA